MDLVYHSFMIEHIERTKNCDMIFFVLLPVPELWLHNPFWSAKRVVGSGHCRLPACLFVWLSAQYFRVFRRNRLMSDWNEIFTIGVTTHAECYIDNYDIIGHVVWQPCWKNRKTMDLCISETTPRKKIETWHMPSTPHGECVIFFMTS